MSATMDTSEETIALKTQMYVGQAEAYLQLCDFQSAGTCYKKAQLLEPGTFSGHLAFIYYLQGQCLFDRGLFSDALELFSRGAELKPSCKAHAVQRLACLAAAGHYADCLKTVNDWMVSDGPTSDLYLLRARLHRRFHQDSDDRFLEMKSQIRFCSCRTTQ